jgi:3',5'-cyclic AMP phosphodiesterase CpdA
MTGPRKSVVWTPPVVCGLVGLAVLATLVGCDDDSGPIRPQPHDAGCDAARAVDLRPADPPIDVVDAWVDSTDSSTDTDGGITDVSVQDAQAAPDAEDGAIDAGGDCWPDPQIATVIVLPDTQNYAYTPEIFKAQTRWIVEQASQRVLSTVIGVGDIVDAPLVRDQWTLASAALRTMDGVVPYLLVPGNHDTDPARATLMNDFFAPATMPWITGTWTPGHMENNYMLVDIGPQKWLVVGLEFGPRDAVVTWADGILKAYANLPAIVVTHAYLYDDGTRYDWTAKQAAQDYNPHWYAYTLDQGTNDGEELWRKLVLPNDNVRLVLSGHVPTLRTAQLTSTRPNGTRVHQLLSDYQAWGNGGDGYLRVMDFDYRQRVIRVRTYSPFENKFEDRAGHRFTISLDM